MNATDILRREHHPLTRGRGRHRLPGFTTLTYRWLCAHLHGWWPQ